MLVRAHQEGKAFVAEHLKGKPMWDRIHFTPEEERALKEAEREIARRRWEELGILRPEGGVPPKKKPRRTTPKTPRRRSTQPVPEALARHLEHVAEAIVAAGPLEQVTPEELARMSQVIREGEALVAELRRRGLLKDLEPNWPPLEP